MHSFDRDGDEVRHSAGTVRDSRLQIGLEFLFNGDWATLVQDAGETESIERRAGTVRERMETRPRRRVPSSSKFHVGRGCSSLGSPCSCHLQRRVEERLCAALRGSPSFKLNGDDGDLMDLGARTGSLCNDPAGPQMESHGEYISQATVKRI